MNPHPQWDHVSAIGGPTSVLDAAGLQQTHVVSDETVRVDPIAAENALSDLRTGYRDVRKVVSCLIAICRCYVQD